MKLNTLFIINAIAALIFGLGFLLIPSTMASLYGATLSDAGLYIARMYGAVILGLAALSWLARNTGESEARSAIVPSLFIAWALGLVVVIYGQIIGIVNALGWLNVVLFLLFTVGYGYFQFVKRDS